VMVWLLLSDGLRNKQHCHFSHFTTKVKRKTLCQTKHLVIRRTLICSKLQRSMDHDAVEKGGAFYASVSRKDKLDGLWRKQSLYAFRAFSDSAFSTILFELLSKGLVCFHLSPLLFVGSELFLGSLLGMFSVVANIMGVVERHTEESRIQQQRLETASAQLVADWESLESNSGRVDSFDALEIEELVHWLEALEELEGPGAIKFFQRIVLDDTVEKRATLAHCLGRCQTRSNIVLCTLQQLALKDASSVVRNAARNSIKELIRNQVIPSPDLLVPHNVGFVSVLHNEQAHLSESSSCGKLPFLFGKFQLGTCEEPKNNDTYFESLLENNATPFDRMDVLDIVMFCSLSGAIIGLQLYCLSHSVDLPFRFVALGWVFGVGGLIVYPYSGKLWQYLHRTSWLRALFSEQATFS